MCHTWSTGSGGSNPKWVPSRSPGPLLLSAAVSPRCPSVPTGGDDFYDGIEDMIGYRPGPWMKYSWAVITPVLCVVSSQGPDTSTCPSTCEAAQCCPPRRGGAGCSRATQSRGGQVFLVEEPARAWPRPSARGGRARGDEESGKPYWGSTAPQLTLLPAPPRTPGHPWLSQGAWLGNC